MIGQVYTDFTDDWGIPERITMDGYSLQVGRDAWLMKQIRKHEVKYHVSAPRKQN